MKLVVADLNNRGIYRPLDEIYGEYETNDTGLCNRLLCWELVKIINHIHDDKFEIVLDKRQNPETNNCFTLEDTTMTNTSDINFDDYLPISDIMVQNIIDGKLKLGDKNYYTDFSKRQINDFIKIFRTNKLGPKKQKLLFLRYTHTDTYLTCI